MRRYNTSASRTCPVLVHYSIVVQPSSHHKNLDWPITRAGCGALLFGSSASGVTLPTSECASHPTQLAIQPNAIAVFGSGSSLKKHFLLFFFLLTHACNVPVHYGSIDVVVNDSSQWATQTSSTSRAVTPEVWGGVEVFIGIHWYSLGLGD